MEDGDRSFEYSAYAEPSTVAQYLESLARYLKEGHVHLAVGSEAIQLDLAPNVKIEVAARVKPEKGKGSLQFDISWRRPPHLDDELRIEAGESPEEEGESSEEKEEAAEEPQLEIAGSGASEKGKKRSNSSR
jgi:amphi-Trp domain-containing protein